MLREDQLLFLYTLLDKAMVSDNFELICQHCPMIQFTCKERFCIELKKELQYMLEN